MTAPAPCLHYDLVDPLSWVMDGEVSALEHELAIEVVRLPFELRPPPEPLLDPDAGEWRERWARVRALPGGRQPAEPLIVPWTRKAHELVLHAAELGGAGPMRVRLFDAFFREGLDIGRVDVLVELAVAQGLDRTRTKAVLDVDRHAAAVVEARAEARSLGVREVPSLTVDGRLLQGFHNRDALRTFLFSPK